MRPPMLSEYIARRAVRAAAAARSAGEAVPEESQERVDTAGEAAAPADAADERRRAEA